MFTAENETTQQRFHRLFQRTKTIFSEILNTRSPELPADLAQYNYEVSRLPKTYREKLRAALDNLAENREINAKRRASRRRPHRWY